MLKWKITAAIDELDALREKVANLEELLHHAMCEVPHDEMAEQAARSLATCSNHIANAIGILKHVRKD